MLSGAFRREEDLLAKIHNLESLLDEVTNKLENLLKEGPIE